MLADVVAVLVLLIVAPAAGYWDELVSLAGSFRRVGVRSIRIGVPRAIRGSLGLFLLIGLTYQIARAGRATPARDPVPHTPVEAHVCHAYQDAIGHIEMVDRWCPFGGGLLVGVDGVVECRVHGRSPRVKAAP